MRMQDVTTDRKYEYVAFRIVVREEQSYAHRQHAKNWWLNGHTQVMYYRVSCSNTESLIISLIPQYFAPYLNEVNTYFVAVFFLENATVVFLKIYILP